MRMAERMAKGKFDMNDFLTQLRQLQKWAGWVVCWVCCRGLARCKNKSPLPALMTA